MIPIGYLRANKEEAIARLSIRNIDSSGIISHVLELDKEKRLLQNSLEQNQAKANALNKEISILFTKGYTNEAEKLKGESVALKKKIKKIEQDFKVKNECLLHALQDIPNLPHTSVPKGKGELDNPIIKEHGKLPTLGENASPHWDLAMKYNIINFELGNKITGAGFPVYIDKGAQLQRALINFFINKAIQAGYTEIQPPLMVNESSAYATGQLPDKEGQMYTIKDDPLYMIPTAEVPITNLYRDRILKEDDLPIKNVGYSQCFRREAGSYGKDVRGLNRLHQFDKVELVQIADPRFSYRILDEMVQYVSELLNKLELPYRIVKLCGGDIGFTSAMTFDFEVFSSAQKKWLEVSSVSNFEAFQANRLKLRYKSKNGKTIYAHTLNGSALALPRIVAAILENNQTDKGIIIPKCLTTYTGFNIINLK